MNDELAGREHIRHTQSGATQEGFRKYTCDSSSRDGLEFQEEVKSVSSSTGTQAQSRYTLTTSPLSPAWAGVMWCVCGK